MDNTLPRSFNIVETSLKGIITSLESGQVTSKELVMKYLERIADIDKSGVKLNAVIEINPDAVHLADVFDDERKTGEIRGVLHGVPILIKDNINTHDKMHTSAGSLALKDNFAPYDAFVVEFLRKSGAIILGKTNLSEFANFLTENMPNGYSSRGGQVLNPYGPGKFDVSGSSSGSCAAVAACLCAAALGTETSGSILDPSSRNSVVGIKPTLGLISRTGIIPLAHSLDTAGPIARSVEDAAILLGAMAGVDEKDQITLTSRGKAYSDYTQFLNRSALKGARIGVPRKHFLDDLTEEEMKLFEKGISDLINMGAVIIDPINNDSLPELYDLNVLIYEFKSDINAYLASLGNAAPVKTLKEIIHFNNEHRELALKYGQTILLEAENTSGTLTEPEYIRSRLKAINLSTVEGIDKMINENHLDALLFPSSYGCYMAAMAGYPSITVPAGYTPDGQPMGITFTGMAYSEPALISLAFAYEQGTKKRIPPKL